MWAWGISSDLARVRLAVAALALVGVAWASSAPATVLVTVEEALALAFEEAETTRETLFLTEEQISGVAEAGGGVLYEVHAPNVERPRRPPRATA